MIEILIFFLATSGLLYVILGGADYGAGITELLPVGSKRHLQRHIINRAMGPVWEANHMWLVLIVVILFVGFPAYFSAIMIHLHIPIVALLLGIIVRGTAFTFRHYDAIHAPQSQAVYSLLFGLSSLWSAIWIGILAASLGHGSFDPVAPTFWDAYIAPWWGTLPLALGCFVAVVFCFLANIFLIGECNDPDLKRTFRHRALVCNILLVLGGALVFGIAHLEGSLLPKLFFSNPLSLLALAGATALLILLWNLARKGAAIYVRLCAASQVALIVAGWYAVVIDKPLNTIRGPLTLVESAAPPATLYQLVLALCVGSLFIFPSLIYLLRVFKRSLPEQPSNSSH